MDVFEKGQRENMGCCNIGANVLQGRLGAYNLSWIFDPGYPLREIGPKGTTSVKFLWALPTFSEYFRCILEGPILTILVISD